MKNFKKAAIRLLAVCIAIALCNIPCVALGAEAVSVTAVTVVGANYTLPAKVNDKAVEWTANAVNTSVAGNHYYTGTDSDGATVNLTLKVMETETIFSDDMESYEVGSSATRPSLVDGKGLSLAAYNVSTNNAYIESVSGTKAVKISPKSAWTNKFVIGEEAYTGDFEANMKLKVINRQGATNYDLLQVRMSAADANNANMVGGFYLRNVRNANVYGEQEIDEIFVAGYDGTAAAISSTKLPDINTEIITDNNEEIGYSTEWINVKLVYNSSALSYDIYVKNKLVIRDIKLTQYAATETGIKTIYFADRNSTGDVSTYIDDVSIKKLVDTEAYKTLIYEDMEKFQADTDATAGTATRPTLIRANTEATTATAGLVFSEFDSVTNDIYVKNIDGNNVIYNNGQTSWNNYLSLPQTVTGNFDVTARVKFDVEDVTTGNFISLVAHDSVLDKSAGGIRLTYSTNLLAITYTQAGTKEPNTTNTNIGSYVSVTENGNRRASDWIDIRLSFSNDKTYDIYINDSLIFEDVAAYNGADATGKTPTVDQIKFACRGTDGTFTSMIDDIKVTAPNTSSAAKQLLVAGDSIAAGYDLNADTRGWGMVIGERMQNITVNNNAVAGQYTRSFFENNIAPEDTKLKINRFDELMWEANPGDILVLSFGHNDRSHVTDNEYTIDDYKKYLGKFINKAKAYGVTTILATSIAEAYFDGENVSESREKYTAQIKDFAAAMKAFAAENNVSVIDLYTKTKTLLATIGEGSADNYYVADKTHLLERGAKTVARYLTDGFALTPLAPYVKVGIVDGGIVMTANVADGITIVNNNDVNYPLSKLVKAEYTGTILDTAAITDAALEAGGTYNTGVTVTDGNTARVFLFESLDKLVPLTTSENVK